LQFSNHERLARWEFETMANVIKLDEAKKIAEFMRLESLKEHVENVVDQDVGSCVIGNGIYVYVLPTNRHKHARKIFVFRNVWTQSEQEKALKKLIKLAEKKFPQSVGKIFYDCGSMN